MKFADREIHFDSPRVMGVLNLTPDSFSDGGKFFSSNKPDIDKALSAAEAMVAAGADFIDIGGESTRPGAAAVSLEEESERVLPLVEKLATRIDAVISVDTSRPQIMLEAAKLGMGLINDIRALSQPGAQEAGVETGLPVCLMHMQGSPQTMQRSPEYKNVALEVRSWLEQRMHSFVQAGGRKENIILDPGFGFGKTDAHNLTLLESLRDFEVLGQPILAGLSRKSMIGRLLEREVEDRLAGSLALALAAVRRGANIVRVHDVQETVDILKLGKIIGEY